MEYRASSVALSQKLSTGHSLYDGVFSSAASKFNVSTFSSRVEDYSEIFGGSEASRGASSIPVLEVPELHERKASVDFRSSKLDYSNVFGGFGDSDFAVPYEELFAEPKKKDRSHKKKRAPAERRSPSEEADASSSDGNRVMSHESFDGGKKFNMSYHKSSHRSKSFTGGTTGIAQLDAVPAYTCLIDEIGPSSKTEGDKPVLSASNGACPDSNLSERIMEANHSMKVTRDHFAADASKQTSGGGAKIQNSNDTKRSNSNDELFNAYEIGEGTHPSNRPSISSLLSEGKIEFEKPMASTFGVSKSDNFEGSGSVYSPPYFDEEVETNSIAAASVDALRKAIEEAQARIKMAKELKERKKVGVQNRVKHSFNNGMKPEVRKGDTFADKVNIHKERKTQELHEEVTVPVHASTGPEQVTAAFEDADKLFGAKEAGGETQEKESAFTEACHRQEEADVSEAVERFYEFSDAGEPDVSEAAEQFYEFADSGEPDLSEAVEQFYDISDSSEPLATSLEHEEPNSAIEVMQFVDKDEQKTKKTIAEAFENSEIGGERLQVAEEEKREVEKIFNAYVGTSVCEVCTSELASAQEALDQEENEKIREPVIEHEETAQLKASEVKEKFEEIPGEFEKQGGDKKGLETPELQDTKHVKRKLIAHEFTENEKIGKEACKQEESVRERKDVDSEKDNKESRQEIIQEILNDMNDVEDFEKRLKDESKSKGNEKLQDPREKEKILEGNFCQKKECEKGQKESFQWVEVGRMQKLIDLSIEDEKIKVAPQDLKNPDCNFEAGHNLFERGESEDLNKAQGLTRHVEYEREVEETPEVPEHEETLEVPAHEATRDVKYDREVEETLEVPAHEETPEEPAHEETSEVPAHEETSEVPAHEAARDAEYDREVEETLEVPAHEETSEVPAHEATRDVEYDREVKETLEVPAHEEDGDRIEVPETFIELKENGSKSESAEEDNGMVEKVIHETDGLAPGVKLSEMEDGTEIHSSDKNGITVKRNDMSFGQKQVCQLAREPEVICNLGKDVEESGDMNSNMMEAEVAVNQEENNNNFKSPHRKRWSDIIDISETLIKLKENGSLSDSVEEENAMEEKEICEADGLTPGVKLAEILKQMEDAVETLPSDENGIYVNSNAMNYEQKQNDQLPREPIVVCNLEMQAEEFEEINKDMMKVEVAVNQEENRNNSKSSHRKRWFGDGNNTEVAHLSHMFRRKLENVLLDHEVETSLGTKENKNNREKVRTGQRLVENEGNQQANLTKESETIDSSLKELEQEKRENHQTSSTAEDSETDHILQKDVKEGKKEDQATLTTEESEKNNTWQKEVEQEKKENRQETLTGEECETSGSLQKEVEIEKEQLKQKDNAKGRERERVKEKKAVERVIREARERAFAEARERAAETRQRAITEAQQRLGKTSVQVNDNSLAEKASKEARLKAERAAVERATVEARDRALEKALSGKAAYEGGKQARRSVAEKFSGASRDDGMKPGVSPVDPESKGSFPSTTSRYPNSSNQGDPYSSERCGGTNGESAQRSKARLERNQRTAERAAKALAEKNMRDLLVQKEQAERNRLAEALDAEVKRWSSGKERNLRALLSTLQYILGPDSGWQPIPLTDVVTAVAVKKAYRKAALFVHPDKLQQRRASIQQKYTCEKVFDLLKEAWNRFNVEER